METYSKDGHWIKRCSCGKFISQCRCSGERKTEIIVSKGCKKCQKDIILIIKGCKEDEL